MPELRRQLLPARLMSAKVPAIAVASLLAIVALTGSILLWSANKVDDMSIARERTIVANILTQSIDRVAHMQEGSTYWDDSIMHLRRRPLDMAWIDNNLGVWFHDYAGHDEVYIVDGQNRPLYAMMAGKRVPEASYTAIANTLAPVLQALRANPEQIQAHHDEVSMLTPGLSDVALLRGKPVIVSAKPLVSDTGDIVQAPGTEMVHISIVHIDGHFLGRLSARAGVDNAHFSYRPSSSPLESSSPIRDRNGQVIGYFVWRASAPGATVAEKMMPAMIAALVLVALIIAALSRKIYRRTLDLEESRADAERLALHDVLTGLPNRALFEDRLETAINRSRRDNMMVALLTIDLDGFKLINDTHGHPAGDAMIRSVGARLAAEIREYDTIARLGGDEFAVILVAPDGVDTVAEICNRLIAVVAEPHIIFGAPSFVGASIGVSLAPRDGWSAHDLIRKSDIALYKAKAEGRNRAVFFSPALDAVVQDREAVAHDLRAALSDPDSQLTLHYQPIMSTASGVLTAVEALLRWNHPERGLIAPHGFIEMAEQSGLIGELGDWVIGTAIADASRWPGTRVSVNVSPVQMRDPALAARIARHLKKAGMAPAQLQIEVTENLLMKPCDQVAETLRALRDTGVTVALDDFGTGFSSLGRFRELAVDRIKIDRCFVGNLGDSHGRELVRALIGLAHASGLDVTAEGVETVEQMQFLAAAGCDEMQGYYFAQPMPAEAIAHVARGDKKAGERPILRVL